MAEPAAAVRQDPILSIDDLHVYYGQGHVLQGVSLRLDHGVLAIVGNEDPEDIPRLVQGLAAGYDMVIASRFLPGAHSEDYDKWMFTNRRWGNVTFTWLVNRLWSGPRRITDTINGYRAITRAAFLRLAPDAEGYAIEFQMSIRALALGLAVLEIPTHEGGRIGKGVSKLNAFPVGIQFLRLMLRERMRPRIGR